MGKQARGIYPKLLENVYTKRNRFRSLAQSSKRQP